MVAKINKEAKHNEKVKKVLQKIQKMQTNTTAFIGQFTAQMGRKYGYGERVMQQRLYGMCSGYLTTCR